MCLCWPVLGAFQKLAAHRVYYGKQKDIFATVGDCFVYGPGSGCSFFVLVCTENWHGMAWHSEAWCCVVSSTFYWCLLA